MKQHPCHKESIVALKRIEGQIRGVQKMIEDSRYCIDILIQLRSATRAIGSVKKKIYKRHLEACVTDALNSKSHAEKQKKIDEIVSLLNKHPGG